LARSLTTASSSTGKDPAKDQIKLAIAFKRKSPVLREVDMELYISN